jgi:hypothetical protein
MMLCISPLRSPITVCSDQMRQSIPRFVSKLISQLWLFLSWRLATELIQSVFIEEHPDREISSLNFARLIQLYFSPFYKLEPQTALQYAYLVCLNADVGGGVGAAQKAAALDQVRDIVLASRSWSKLLGSVRQDGTKEVSVRSEFCSPSKPYQGLACALASFDLPKWQH